MSTPVATANGSTESTRDRPAVRGTVAGLGAALLGYLLVYLRTAREVEAELAGLNALVGFFGGDGVPTWKGVGWLAYNAHNVAFRMPTRDGTAAHSFIGSSGELTALYLLPPALLLLAGFLVARSTDRTGRPRRAALAGASVAGGYCVVALAGAFLTGVEAFGRTAGPDLLAAALLAGVAYPVVFGGLGGALASLAD